MKHGVLSLEHKSGGFRDKRSNPYDRNKPRFHHGRPHRRTAPMQRQLRPMPIGERCNPLCPFFICTKNAKMISTKFYRGRTIKVVFCRLYGGECIGASCKYATCKINAMLPDGRCAKALRFKTQKYTDEDLEKEARELEDYDIEEFS